MPFLRYLVFLQLSPCNSSCHSMSVHLALHHSMLSLHHFMSLPAPPEALSVTPSLPVSPCSTLCHSLHTLHHSTTSTPVSLCYSLQHSLSLSVSSCITHCYYLSLPSSLCHSQPYLQHSLSLSVTFCPSLQSLQAAAFLPNVLPGFLLVRANL